MFESFSAKISKAPEFPSGFRWINSEAPLSLESLKGHVIVLDFWTYCCINCMHTLPVLSQLEKKYEGRPVTFIGVHSAKFSNEQDAKNIEHAVLRYEISHPVLVDENMSVWQKYGVSGWPTIAIIDPRGNIVYKQSGEGQGEIIEDMIESLLEAHGRTGTLEGRPFRKVQSTPRYRTFLAYPGKISISDGRMAISDSNHHRILVTDMNGKISQIIGSGKAGFSDGSFESAEFFRPQGIAWKDESIFVADTENHAIRKADLNTKRVETLAGTGRQGPWMSRGGIGKGTALSSPWDIAVKNDLLFIAMAGSHQIWTHDTRTGLSLPFAGTGYENIVDGNITVAQLAQPSGLSLFGDALYFTDSETSSIRMIDLRSGHVRTLAGSGLFDFGHRDGNLDEALFQHPLGLCATQNRIFVADTYNSALREINLETGSVSTLIGKPAVGETCKPGGANCDMLGLYEPSDVKAYMGMLYISDTNNHLIRVYDPATNEMSTLELGLQS